jgi:hypothetical protein
VRRRTRLGAWNEALGLGKADDGEVQHDGDGEKASRREGEREGENRPARTITPRRNSGGGSRQ